ncbi:MAG TPA: rhodanese-like domain-containing protein [Candidatus Enterocloster excrementipullorum]|uniref:Rhodanese-like domain-containing protein n=1 Tax=Candidatus Enterocloster excrementipullorum TaxID=2838559 RepID=A0A9D2N136_9FIRM|nr:rhodanese-like domain-containing protein [Candidatus Enterocloster excrementipullorum]
MSSFPMLSYREFDRWLEEGKIGQLIDLREPWLFRESRIWGSVNIPYDEIESRADQLNPNGTLVFYCDRGAKSMVVCRDLWRLGWDVADLAGGILNYRGKYIDKSPSPKLK